MVDPISMAQYAAEIGAADGLSQASAFSGGRAAAEADRQEPPAQFSNLRHYLKQMQGLLLDTQV